MIIQNFLGWFTFFFVFFIFHQISTKNKKIRNFLISALILRAFFVVLDQYFINLPDSTGDAYSFEIKAHTFSQEYGLTIFSKFLQDDSYFISKFISIFYTCLVGVK